MRRLDVESQLASGSAGGDLWNRTTIALRAREAGAVAVEYRSIVSGLSLHCTLVMADGSRRAATLYGHAGVKVRYS